MGSVVRFPSAYGDINEQPEFGEWLSARPEADGRPWVVVKQRRAQLGGYITPDNRWMLLPREYESYRHQYQRETGCHPDAVGVYRAGLRMKAYEERRAGKGI